VVQFYDHDDQLAAGVGPYLADGIRDGGVAIVIATEAHRDAFTAWLAHAGMTTELVERGLALTGGTLVVLDAREAADSLLIDGRIAPHRFDKLIGDLVREAVGTGRTVRAYGEIVALLWADGHIGAALELEELWNGLGREVDFSLYCGYPRSWVGADGDDCSSVCRLHSAVVDPPAVVRPAAPPPGAVQVRATFPWSGRSPASVRFFVRRTLVAWGRSDLLDDAALVVTELATNALLHAQTDFTVALSREADGAIRVEVHDASPVRPQPRQAGPLDSSGRGLRLVDTLSAHWGAELVPDGKVVWAEFGR
jgi:hypothetical protein